MHCFGIASHVTCSAANSYTPDKLLLCPETHPRCCLIFDGSDEGSSAHHLTIPSSHGRQRRKRTVESSRALNLRRGSFILHL